MIHEQFVTALSRPWGTVLIGLALAVGGCASTTQAPLLSEQVHGDGKMLVLLPDSPSKWAQAGDAVWAGVQAAALKGREAASKDGRPQPILVRQGSGGKDGEVYRAFAAEGLAVVIGPLETGRVAALAKNDLSKAPVLALNTYDGGNRPGLYQFALAPTADSQAIAEVAIAAKLKAVVVLRPKGAWGDLLVEDLKRRLNLADIGTKAVVEYPTELGARLDAAAQKHLGQADLVVLLAAQDYALGIYPQIRSVAPAVPVIATSDVHDGAGDTKILKGLYFVEIPHRLPENASRQASDPKLRSGFPARLYAMGLDAYGLGAVLTGKPEGRNMPYRGQTGILQIDDKGVVQRTLTLARFDDNGKAQIVPGGKLAAASGSPAEGQGAKRGPAEVIDASSPMPRSATPLPGGKQLKEQQPPPTEPDSKKEAPYDPMQGL